MPSMLFYFCALFNPHGISWSLNIKKSFQFCIPFRSFTSDRHQRGEVGKESPLISKLRFLPSRTLLQHIS